MATKDKDYKVEDWNGYDIYVDGAGTFFIKREERARIGESDRLAEAKSIDALKKSLAAGQEVEIKGMMLPLYSYSDSSDALRTVTVVKITGLGNLMYRTDSPKASVEKARKHEQIYVFSEERQAERARLLALQKKTQTELTNLMKQWPLVTAPKKEA